MTGPGDSDTSGAPQNAPGPGRILLGDALLQLQQLPAACVDVVVTSPPYFRLRDYGAVGQLGLEDHVDAWVHSLRQVMRETARVLSPSGTVWLNLGDTYATHPSQGAPRKSLLAAPERLLLALIEDGWTVRNKIIWAKRNHTPTSVTDRLANTYEVIYVLSLRPRYFFDLDAIRVPHLTTPPKRRRGPRGRDTETTRPPTRTPERPAWLGPNADHDAGLANLRARGLVGHPLGKNPGDIWHHSTSSYRGAHFATYPEHLVARILTAGCPEQVCLECRAPYVRPMRRLGATATRLALRASCDHDAKAVPGLVLDPFMGSGTTAIAAETLGRDWLGIELNPDYRQMAIKRIRQTRQEPQQGDQPTTDTTKGGTP